MQTQEIEHYLVELGAALESQGITKPVRMLLIGGAYMMLLANAPRTTDDVDIFWMEEGEDFQRAREALRDGAQAIASKYTLPPNWFNYLTQMLIYDKIKMPRGKLWKHFGPLQIYAPPTLGGIVFLASVAMHQLYQQGQWRRLERSLPVSFPSQPSE